MKRIIKITSLFLFISVFVIAQDFDYEVSQPYKTIETETKKYFHKEGKVLSVKVDDKKRVYLQTWDTGSLNELNREEYDDFPKDYEIESISEIKGKFYLFYSSFNKSKKNYELFVRPININSGQFEGAGKLLISPKKKVAEAVPKNFSWWTFEYYGPSKYSVKFNIQKSFNQSKVLIQYRNRPESRDDSKNHDVIGLPVFDENLELISSQEIKMPYTEAKMNNLDYSVDSKGNTHILSLVFKDDSQKIKTKNGRVNYKIELIRVDLDSKELHKTRVSVGSKNLNDILVYNQEDDKVICAGFYSKAEDKFGGLIRKTDGIAIFRDDEDSEVADLKTYEIPIEVINMYQSKAVQKQNTKQEKKDKAELYHMVMEKMIIDNQENVILIGEQQYKEEDSGSTSSKPTYHFNEVIITKLDKDGELVWMNKLGKLQSGNKGQGGMSFEYFSNKNSNYILFLDNVKNLELEPDEKPARHQDGKGGFFTAYKIDHETGEVNRVSLFDTRDVKGINVYDFHISRIVQISPTEFIVEVYKKSKEDILIKVSVKS